MLGEWATITPSDTALRSKNPIRRIVEGLVKPDLPDKPHIPLSLGETFSLRLFGSGKCAKRRIKHITKRVLNECPVSQEIPLYLETS